MKRRLDIEGNVRAYLRRRQPTQRYASFDYCFNHFQQHRERSTLVELVHGDALQLSCLHLGFYLASWGMLRGKASLLQRSVKALVPLVEVIAQAPREIWEMDANKYGDGHCEIVFDVAHRIKDALTNGASATLTTKIMLGTFGCVPAFDRYFKKGLGVSTFGPKALRKIGDFYEANAEAIERSRVPTLDFVTGKPTKRRYTQAKVIDMVFFVAGGR